MSVGGSRIATPATLRDTLRWALLSVAQSGLDSGAQSRRSLRSPSRLWGEGAILVEDGGALRLAIPAGCGAEHVGGRADQSRGRGAMLSVVVGHSDDPDASGALADVLETCRAGLAGRTPSAGILFSA